MMITANLLLKSSSLLIIILALETSHATKMNIPHCTPSSCGIIRNISFPFRLKVDPRHCGHPDYELECENNVTTILYLNSQKFKVEAINYNNLTMRVVDVSINNNTCSFPNHSLNSRNFSDGYPYSTGMYRIKYFISERAFPDVAWPINFMSCPHPLIKNSSSLLTPTHDCASNFSNSRHTYIQAGPMKASDVKHMCRVDMYAITSWKFEDLKNVSISEIHESLVYGFELSWYRYPCTQCKSGSFCFLDKDQTTFCDIYKALWSLFAFFLICLLLLILSILVCVCVGVSIPAKIVIGFALAFCGLVYLSKLKWTLDHIGIALNTLRLLEFIEVSLIVRFIIGFPCLMVYLIYKFRTNALSAFDAIEKFLQSDNKIKPIRYSYSEIKKMTRGFREKLGQGGFGTVYKGKLRSGRDVAVKLLGKPNENGQDFINEIATIGRIHHVNVASLVGYCAVGSKRALVYDFMPNGSLDKYLFNNQNMNSLSWENKYEIAVGVARGIEYLHKGCNIQILHFDIKPHNILLDHNFSPKISDFGLAKYFSTEKSTVSLTAARGTIGYVAPELINRAFGEVSYKADVYSFGMLLIEMVGLKRDLRGNNQTSSQYFPCWIYDSLERGKEIEFGVSDDDNSRKIAKKMTIVALWCIQMVPGDRPSMNKVVEMLEAQVERLVVPNRPPESGPVAGHYEDQSLMTTYSTDSVSEITVVND